jgi:RNA polymerase sigma-70 factor (ECF subfamily)
MARLQLASAHPAPQEQPVKRDEAKQASAHSGDSGDEDILRGLRAGEPAAAERLYERVHLSVRASLRRIVRAQAVDVDDLMQMTFERMLVTLGRRSLKAPYNLPAWASAVAAHVALDALRRMGRERRIFEADAEVSIAPGRPDDADPERRTAARAEIERLQSLLASLRPKYAEAVVLHDVLGHDLAAIAELTGISVAAAQSRLSRGRRELLQKAERLTRREQHGKRGQR